jgi:hypothetical protein
MAYEVWTVEKDERGYYQRQRFVSEEMQYCSEGHDAMHEYRAENPAVHLGLYFYNTLTLQFYPSDIWPAYTTAPFGITSATYGHPHRCACGECQDAFMARARVAAA